MMNISSPANLFGLFEIDDNGRILYARTESDENVDSQFLDITGKNFFQLVPAESRTDFEKNISLFISSQHQADSFYLMAHEPDGDHRIKVLMGRIQRRDNKGEGPSVLVHLRKI